MSTTAKRANLGIDQGSSSTKMVLVGEAGETLCSSSRDISTKVQDQGRVEQDAQEIFSSVADLIDEAMRFAASRVIEIRTLGISCQRSAVVAWEGVNGKALSPLLSWRDTRLAQKVAGLSSHRRLVAERSGLPLNVHYAALKIALLQKEFPKESESVGTLDTFLLSRLLGKLITEDTHAARSMLYNLNSAGWDDELCDLFEVQRRRLPPIVRSVSARGSYRNLPVCAVVGDQQAACFALNGGAQQPILNIGTVASLMIPTGKTARLRDGYISSVFYSSEKQGREYQIEATANSAGATIDLLVHHLKLIRTESELDGVCRRALDSGRKIPTAYFPLCGTGSPEWRTDLPNVLLHWDGKDHDLLVCALIESLGAFIAQAINALLADQAQQSPNTEILVAGGISQSDYLLQYIADVSGFALVRSESQEAGAYGAALLASGEWGNSSGLRRQGGKIAPQSPDAKHRFQSWCALSKDVHQGKISKDMIFDIGKRQA